MYFYYITCVCSRYSVHSDLLFVELEVRTCSGPGDIFEIFIHAFSCLKLGGGKAL